MAGSIDVEALGERLCNWETWGADDQAGTVNYITPAKTAAAASLIGSGRIYALSIPLDNSGPAVGSPRRFNPRHYMMILPHEEVREGEVGIADDVLMLPLQCSTQWDSLAHVSFKGMIYGGRPISHVTSAGAAVNDVRNFSDRLATRGVLADIAQSRGVASLGPGEAIEADEVDSVLASTGTTVGEGDVLLVRTGYLDHCRANGWQGYSGDAPGLGMSMLEWLHDRRVAASATDTYAVEVKPYGVTGSASPFHCVALVYIGLLLGEIFDLDELAAACATDGRYEFFFVGAGLPVTGAVGTPVNPYAIR